MGRRKFKKQTLPTPNQFQSTNPQFKLIQDQLIQNQLNSYSETTILEGEKRL